MTNRTFSINGAVILLLLFAAAQQLDGFETQAERERREWIESIQHCRTLYKVEAAVDVDDAGRKVCVTRRGEVLPYTKGDKRELL